MNIFLDTTLTYQDPFLKTLNNSILLKIVEELGGCIYISTVVLEETKEHLRKNISKELRDLNSSIEKYNKLVKNEVNIDIESNIETHIKELDKFYKGLEEKGVLEIVEYDNNILPIIVERAIKRKKPFDEKKDEFRDAIIWLSYANYINENELEECYFLTNNTSDYYDDDKRSLHPDLQGDCTSINLIKSAKELISSTNEEIKEILPSIKEKVKLEKWMELNPINEESVTELLNNNCEDRIINYVNNYFLDGNTPSNSEYVVDYLELDTLYVTGIKGVFHEIIDDEIYISGTMKLDVYADNMVYNSVRDKGEDRYSNFGGLKLYMELEFSLTHNGPDGIDDFEINGVWSLKEVIDKPYEI